MSRAKYKNQKSDFKRRSSKEYNKQKKLPLRHQSCVTDIVLPYLLPNMSNYYSKNKINKSYKK